MTTGTMILIYAIALVFLTGSSAYFSLVCMRQSIANAAQTEILRIQMANMIKAQLDKKSKLSLSQGHKRDWDQSEDETQTIQDSIELAYTQHDFRKPY